MNSFKTLFAVLLVAGLSFSSCDEIIDPIAITPQDSEELKTDSEDNSKADNAMGAAFEDISSYGISEDWSKKMDGNEPIQTYDPVNFIVTLKFSNDGIITIDWNVEPTWNAINLMGVVDIVNYNNNGTVVNATGITLVKGGTETQPTLTISGPATIAIGTMEMTFTIDRTFEFYAGRETWDNLTDDIFAIWGTSTLNKSNKTITTVILEEQKIIKEVECTWPKQGITTLSVSGTQKSVTMDYGIDANGEMSNICDSWANLTLKVGNATLTIKTNLDE